MNLTVEKLPECRAKLSAEVPADTVNSTLEEVVGLFMSQASLPGFRPGKLPKNVVKKKFKSQIEQEVRERLVRDIITQAISDEELELLGIKEVERENFEVDGAFSFISELVTKPEVELSKDDYMNIPVEVYKSEFDEAAMEEFMVRIQTNFAEYEDVDRPAQKGDKIKIEYTSTRDGEPFIDSVGERQKYLAETMEEPLEFEIPKEISPYEPIPGLMHAIVGMKPGDSKDIEVNFGDDYQHDETLQNVKVVYKLNLINVAEAKLPELSDELAQKLGLESIDQLKDHFRQGQERELEQRRQSQIEQGILEHLNKEHELELPQDLVFDETQHMVNQMAADAAKQGMNPEDLDQHENEIIETAGVRAVNNLRTRYLLEEISKTEGIEVSDEDLSQAIAFEAHRANRPIKKFVREIENNNGLASVRANLLISKTIDFLKENATITEVDPPEPEVEQPASNEEE